jgi:hypothetical protein
MSAKAFSLVKLLRASASQRGSETHHQLIPFKQWSTAPALSEIYVSLWYYSPPFFLGIDLTRAAITRPLIWCIQCIHFISPTGRCLRNCFSFPHIHHKLSLSLCLNASADQWCWLFAISPISKARGWITGQWWLQLAGSSTFGVPVLLTCCGLLRTASSPACEGFVLSGRCLHGQHQRRPGR